MSQCIFLNEIRLRINLINDTLTNSYIHPKILARLHLSLCELTTINNRMSAFQISSMIGINIMNTTLVLFELYDVLITDSNNPLKIFFCVGAIVFSSYFTILIIFYVVIASVAVKEGGRTTEILGQILIKGFGIERCENLKILRIFMLQLKHFNLNVTCGFFDIDWKVFMMVKIV